MNTIDQRILIPTPPDVVWNYLGDLTRNAEWQADCKAVSFLTSKRSGPGTRMRISADKGQDRVIEITAWYDGLGYQYTYVDGMPFRESTGRIRLQEIPEGTVVQWTFTYEVGGLRFGLGRQIESTMEASLKSLWRQVSQLGVAQKIREAKSLMRDAPDYEARAQYKPRHPSIDVTAEDGAPASQTGPTQPIPSVPLAPALPPAASRAPVIDEPPISEEDTRPRRPAAVPDALIQTTAEPDAIFRRPEPDQPEELVETTAEPDFLDQQASRLGPPPDIEPTADTQPIKPIVMADLPDEAKQTVEASVAEPDFDFDFEPVADEPPAAIASIAEIVEPEAVIHAPETDLAPSAAEAEPVVAVDQPEDIHTEPTLELTAPVGPTEAPTQAIEPQALPKPAEPEPRLPGKEELSKRDTAKMSIWEIFGVPKPSEAPAEPVVEAPPAPPPAEEKQALASEVTVQHIPADVEPIVAAAPVSEPTVHSIRSYELPPSLGGRRGGLRIRMRRKAIKLRFPQ